MVRPSQATGERFCLYRWWRGGPGSELIYLGISNSVTLRLEQHQADKGWFAWCDTVTLEHFPLGTSRAEVLAAEARAIRRERPVMNVAGSRSTDWVAWQRAKSEWAASVGREVPVLAQWWSMLVAWVRREVRWWRGAACRAAVVGAVSVTVWAGLALRVW